jgi:hypothetical protein
MNKSLTTDKRIYRLHSEQIYQFLNIQTEHMQEKFVTRYLNGWLQESKPVTLALFSLGKKNF